jgi:hypothetical protein
MFDASLHRPGHRFASADGGVRVTVADVREQAYRSYEDAMSSAWKRTADAEGAEGAACTVKNSAYPRSFGSAGHIKNGVCVPDQSRDSRDDGEHQQTLDELYLERDREMANAWRNPS